jgi:hypothetical protein
MAGSVEFGKFSKRDRKDKKIELAQKLIVIACGNIKKGNPSRSRRLVRTPVLKPSK